MACSRSATCGLYLPLPTVVKMRPVPLPSELTTDALPLPTRASVANTHRDAVHCAGVLPPVPVFHHCRLQPGPGSTARDSLQRESVTAHHQPQPATLMPMSMR